jgi:hypothetical protein
VHTKFRQENLKETVLYEDLGVDGRVILKWIKVGIKKQDGRLCSPG